MVFYPIYNIPIFFTVNQDLILGHKKPDTKVVFVVVVWILCRCIRVYSSMDEVQKWLYVGDFGIFIVEKATKRRANE